MKSLLRAILSITLILFPFLLSSCVTGAASSGRLQRRLEVEKLFDSGTLLSDHSYYIQGPLSEPDAIIAISNKFQLQSTLWGKMEWSGNELGDVVRWMRFDERGGCTTDAGVLLAPYGEEIGIWFSKRDSSVIREPSPGVVEIYPFQYNGISPCARREHRDSR
jgi:hypothetical protein